MKLQKTQLSILVGLTLMSGLASAATFDRADVRYLSPSEFAQRQPEDPQQEAFGPLNFDSAQVYNHYNPDTSLPKVEAYMSNWGQYGRKWSPKNIAGVYDTIVFSFMAMCGTGVGDSQITSAVESLQKYACNSTNNPSAKEFEVITTDPWGDIAAAIPGMVGLIDWQQMEMPTLMQKWYQGQNAINNGYLGALKKLKQDSPSTKMAFSIGGWSLSEPFSRMAATKANRDIFVESVVNIFSHYEMFSQVDIDWEYPGIQVGENSWSQHDSDNYKVLIKELRNALNSAGKHDVKIAIAAGAPKDKMDASDLRGLVDNGVDIIHLMTYDFFGNEWAEELNHHSNLYAVGDWSVDTSVSYMIDELGIDPKNIYIGYANYSRNAAHAEVTSFSPLRGSFEKPTHPDSNGIPTFADGQYTGGSWERGTYEWYDIQQEFLEINSVDGLKMNNSHPGYQLLTDKEANADYIYSENGKFFMSFDTPRSVYAKARYVKEKGLGGIFNWMADYDTGYMVNAAREGLGYKPKAGSSNIDMTNIIYSCGENITREECIELTNLGGGSSTPPLGANAGSDVSAQFVADKVYRLDGSASTGDDIIYKWSIKKRLVEGVDPALISLRQARSVSPKISIPASVEVEETIQIPVKLEVTAADGEKANDTVILTLTSGDAVNHKPVAEATVDKTEVVHGTSFTLSGSGSSDPDGDALTYRWSQIYGALVELGNNTRESITVNTDTLDNIDHALKFKLTVSDGQASDTSVVEINVSPNGGGNQAPVAKANVDHSSINHGETFRLNGRRSTDADGDTLTYLWEQVSGKRVNLGDATQSRITVNTSSLDNIDQPLTFKLTVSDGQDTDSARVSVQVSSTNNGGTPGGDFEYEYPTGFGSYVDGTVVKFPGHGVYQCFGAWAQHCNTSSFLPGVAADPNWITQQWRFMHD
ncbi:glycosyl hydrolase family 18 protein [Vibrio aestuarianus]|uniref:glycoside hydrolase family 18 protein n=1 Tax=Vibrio aestuarianus TaxID=28171 RepID=UPI00237C96EB|nr:glycosyl hydrolase family 18 protein [Vibrio aestuarianus]MDE1254796.1 glycosyl hydrolase family 18 protein [Vibrio aestuarianus]